jgi:hypothetical protein
MQSEYIYIIEAIDLHVGFQWDKQSDIKPMPMFRSVTNID